MEFLKDLWNWVTSSDDGPKSAATPEDEGCAHGPHSHEPHWNVSAHRALGAAPAGLTPASASEAAAPQLPPEQSLLATPKVDQAGVAEMVNSESWQRLTAEERAGIADSIARNPGSLATMSKLIGSDNYLSASIDGSPDQRTQARMMMLRMVSTASDFEQDLLRQANSPIAHDPVAADRAKLVGNSIAALVDDRYAYDFSVAGADGTTLGRQIKLNANELDLWKDPSPEAEPAWQEKIIEVLVHETNHAVNNELHGKQVVTPDRRFLDEVVAHSVGKYAAYGQSLNRGALGETVSTLKSAYPHFKKTSFNEPSSEAEKNINDFLNTAYNLPPRYISPDGSLETDGLVSDWENGPFTAPGLSPAEIDARMAASGDPAFQSAASSPPEVRRALRQNMFLDRIHNASIAWPDVLDEYDLDNNPLTLAGLNESTRGL